MCSTLSFTLSFTITSSFSSSFNSSPTTLLVISSRFSVFEKSVCPSLFSTRVYVLSTENAFFISWLISNSAACEVSTKEAVLSDLTSLTLSSEWPNVITDLKLSSLFVSSPSCFLFESICSETSSSLFGEGGGVFVSISDPSSPSSFETSAFLSLHSLTLISPSSVFRSIWSTHSGSEISILILQCMSFKESFFELEGLSWLICVTLSSSDSNLPLSSSFWTTNETCSIIVCSFTTWIVCICCFVHLSIDVVSFPTFSSVLSCEPFGHDGGVGALSTVSGNVFSSFWVSVGDEGGVLTLSWTKMCELRLLPIFFKSTRRLVSSSFTLSLFLSLNSIMFLVAFCTSWIIFSISFVSLIAASSSMILTFVLIEIASEEIFSFWRLSLMRFEFSEDFSVLQMNSSAVVSLAMIELSPLTSSFNSCLYSKWISLASLPSSLLLWDSSKLIKKN